MNKKEIDDIKEKTKGIMNIVKYLKFWNYIDYLIQEYNRQKKIKEDVIKYMEEHKYYAHSIDVDYVIRLVNGEKI